MQENSHRWSRGARRRLEVGQGFCAELPGPAGLQVPSIPVWVAFWSLSSLLRNETLALGVLAVRGSSFPPQTLLLAGPTAGNSAPTITSVRLQMPVLGVSRVRTGICTAPGVWSQGYILHVYLFPSSQLYLKKGIASMSTECNKYRSTDFPRKQPWDGKLRDTNIYQSL